MHQAHLRQIECLITLAEELHFGRAAARLGCSQSRVSQLITGIEDRIGARLVERTSRRVALTRAGARFVADIGPAYRSLTQAFDQARERAARGALEELRIGFTCTVYEEITAAFRDLHDQYGVSVHAHDVPLGSPFTAVSDGEVDAVIAELPVYEPTLTVGMAFASQDQFVVLGAGHPMAGLSALAIEDLAELDLLHRIGDAPDYWRAARTPPATPSGRPIRSSTGITTIAQGMALAATGRFAMLVCRPLVEHQPRSDLRFIPVKGLERSSTLGLVWRHASPQLDTLARVLEASAVTR